MFAVLKYHSINTLQPGIQAWGASSWRPQRQIWARMTWDDSLDDLPVTRIFTDLRDFTMHLRPFSSQFQV